MNPEYASFADTSLLVSIFRGLFLGSVSGFMLGLLLTYTIRFFLESKAQLILAAVSFTFIGYTIVFLAVQQGGYLCALVMGITTSLSYRNNSTEDEIEFLQNSLNL